MSRTGWLATLALVLQGCGGGSDAGEPAHTGATETAPASQAAEAAGYTRAAFVLCPAIEEHRAELAGIVGFEQDLDRAVGSGSECVVRGHDGFFLRVSLLPAIVPSIAAHATSFDGTASPAPELGDDAIFIADGLQPHVTFAMGRLFIDVDAENLQTPDRATMIELALRVREILEGANR